MKKIITIASLFLPILTFAQTFTGVDLNGDDCSMTILSANDGTIRTQVKGKNLNKKITVSFNEEEEKFIWKKEWQLTNNTMSPGYLKFLHLYPDYSDESGKSFKSFTYYQTGMFHKSIDVVCELKK